MSPQRRRDLVERRGAHPEQLLRSCCRCACSPAAPRGRRPTSRAARRLLAGPAGSPSAPSDPRRRCGASSAPDLFCGSVIAAIQPQAENHARDRRRRHGVPGFPSGSGRIQCAHSAPPRRTGDHREGRAPDPKGTGLRERRRRRHVDYNWLFPGWRPGPVGGKGWGSFAVEPIPLTVVAGFGGWCHVRDALDVPTTTARLFDPGRRGPLPASGDTPEPGATAAQPPCEPSWACSAPASWSRCATSRSARELTFDYATWTERLRRVRVPLRRAHLPRRGDRPRLDQAREPRRKVRRLPPPPRPAASPPSPPADPTPGLPCRRDLGQLRASRPR